jgi:hypothetical protein
MGSPREKDPALDRRRFVKAQIKYDKQTSLELNNTSFNRYCFASAKYTPAFPAKKEAEKQGSPWFFEVLAGIAAVDNTVDKKVIEPRFILLRVRTVSGITPLMKFAAHRAAGSRS